MTLHKGRQPDLAAPAEDEISPDHGLEIVVPTLDQDVGTGCLNQSPGRRVVERRYQVDRRKAGKNERARLEAVDGSSELP